MLYYSIINGLLHIVSLTLERFCAIRFPLQYRQKVTIKKILMIILGNWLVALTYLVVLLDVDIYKRALSGLIFIIGTSLVIVYTVILLKVRKVMARRRLNTNTSEKDSTFNRQRETRSYVYCLLVMVVFIIFSFPAAVAEFTNECEYDNTRYVTLLLLTGNAVFNPLLWSFSEWCMVRKKTANQSSDLALRTRGVTNEGCI